MKVEVERRLLQAAVLVACLVPLLAGGAGALQGPDMIRGGGDAGADLDSHFRYLSGLLLGIGLAFLACVPRIERRGSLFQTLGAIAIVGGLARAVSLLQVGPPGAEHQFALAMELGTVPLLMAWQWRLERRWRAAKGGGAS